MTSSCNEPHEMKFVNGISTRGQRFGPVLFHCQNSSKRNWKQTPFFGSMHRPKPNTTLITLGCLLWNIKYILCFQLLRTYSFSIPIRLHEPFRSFNRVLSFRQWTPVALPKNFWIGAKRVRAPIFTITEPVRTNIFSISWIFESCLIWNSTVLFTITIVIKHM